MMKHSRNWFTGFILVVIVFAFWSCATTSSTASRNEEGNIETTPQITNNHDYSGLKMDADISSAIKMKFANDELISGSDIHIDTSRCNVTLNGKVDTQAKADRAMFIGRSVMGVRSVHSDIIVN